MDNVLQHRRTQLAAAQRSFQQAATKLASCEVCMEMN